jgi:cyanophycinase-like exopeptidase
MELATFAVGSLDALHSLLRDGPLQVRAQSDIVIVPTAAAFIGVTEAAVMTAAVFDDVDVRVEALMVSARSEASDQYYVDRLVDAELVVLCDGSALHARSVWRDSALGEAINAASNLVAIGGVASVLGEVMIDPRGGAPTTGLGYRNGAALCQPSSDDQMFRTRSLLGDVTLVTVGATGVVEHDGERWKVITGDVIVTRGHEAVEL